MEPSDELRRLTLLLYEAMLRVDIAFLEQIYSQHDGVHFIGSNPGDWWTDYHSHQWAMANQLWEAGGIEFVGSDPQAFVEGSVGWVADHPRACLDDGAEIPARVTFVFHKEGGQWKIVRSHVSVGEPGGDE